VVDVVVVAAVVGADVAVGGVVGAPDVGGRVVVEDGRARLRWCRCDFRLGEGVVVVDGGVVFLVDGVVDEVGRAFGTVVGISRRTVVVSVGGLAEERWRRA
jgi:hypothetical protein